MKKVLYLVEMAHPSKQGGIETFGRVLKKMFKEDLYCVAYEATKKIEDHKVEDIIEIPCKGRIYKSLNKLTNQKLRKYMLLRKIKHLKYNIAIINYPKDIEIFKDKKVFSILVQHACYENYINSTYLNDPSLIVPIRKDLGCFVFLSEYDRQTFIKNLGLEYNKTAVIRHSSEMPLLEEKKEKSKKLIMIARLDNKGKRFDLAIRAMKKLPDYSLNIYGNGMKEEKTFLNELIKNENINNVNICGPTNEVQKRLDESAIFLMTSDYEGYGITLIEAMRRGLPLIVRDTYDAARDIVIDNGILLQKEWNEDEFVEAIKKIYDNYEYYSQNSIKIGQRHNFDIIKNEWEQLFNKLN